MKQQKRPKTKRLNKIILFLAIIAIFLVVAGIISGVFYDSYFARGGVLPLVDKLNYEPENAVFEGLERTRYEFPSNKGQTIVGYNYQKTDKPKALIIFAHGFGGDHNYYKPLINSLASRDYWVFAFDATGTGESDGDSMIGLEQHIIDLEYTLKFIQSEPAFKNLGISLVGHSWGGYAAAALLNLNPDVSSIVLFSGFSNAYDLESNRLRNMVGGIGNLALPYLKIIQMSKFGKYESFTGLSGLEKSSTPGLMIASENDTIVNPEFGYKLYQKNLPESRLEYIILNKRGHATYWTDEALQKHSDFIACTNGKCNDDAEQKIWDDCLDKIYAKYSLGEDDDISKHADAWAEVVDFLNSRFSADIWQDSVDEELIDRVDEFIMRNLNFSNSEAL